MHPCVTLARENEMKMKTLPRKCDEEEERKTAQKQRQKC